MEHHSNIVPWQLLAERTGATLRWFDVTDEGRLDLAGAADTGLVNERTRIISVAYVSNVLGTVNPVREIVALGHAVGATVVLDASQAVPQLPVDVVDARVPTWSPSPVTRWSVRPASACCGGATTCSPSCRRSSVAAR